MESVQSSNIMLSMFSHPVFTVSGGVITSMNQAARDLQLVENTSIFDLLQSGAEEYRALTEGNLSLTLRIGPMAFVAAVIKGENIDYFHLDHDSGNGDLKAMALASQYLRDPLTNVIALTDSLLDTGSDHTEKERIRISQLEQNLHRLLRCVGNMSDVQGCAGRTASEHWNITAVITEAVQRAQQQCGRDAHRLLFTADGDSVTGTADRDLLERAVYNMLSNALRHSDPETTIRATLCCDRKNIQFTVDNQCAHASNDLLAGLFFRYQRAPGISGQSSGLGLGIPMIRAAAAAHKGSLLVTLPEPGKIRFSLTIPVLKDTGGNLRSTQLRPDYTGGFDRSLIELSDVLPYSAYNK